MRKHLQTLVCLALFASACGEDPTAILVNIFAESGADIVVPTDVNQLRISVEVADEEVWVNIFPRDYNTPRPLEESITFRPGKVADDAIRIVVTGLYDDGQVITPLVTGRADAKFISTKIQHANVALDWMAGVCLDRDGDSHGKGLAGSCAGTDCDDSDPEVNQSAREDCNNKDDNCDGETDNVLEQDKPRCEHYKGVCRTARKTCSGGVWLDCDIGGYGLNYEEVEESCDENDNDCDGAIDEGCSCTLGDERMCDAPDQGECNAGLQSCEQVGPTEGEWGEACVGAIPPVDEQCNRLDDDCDGSTDEDFDLLNDPQNCGGCGNVCGAGLDCYNGHCLPKCPAGLYPTTTDGVPVCLSPLQEAATPCEAFTNCAELVEGGMVGYGGDGLVLPADPPADFYREDPIIVWTKVTQEVDTLYAQYRCIDTTPAPLTGGQKNCPDCNTSCDNCVPENCPESNTECGKCGCALRYWCHIEM